MRVTAPRTRPGKQILRTLTAAVLTMVLLSAAPLAAAGPILDITGGFQAVAGTFVTLGWEFTVSSPVSVRALGIFDFGADGLVNSHDLGLWTTDGTLLAWAKITTLNSSLVGSTSADGAWRSTPIEPLVLPAGIYVVGATYRADQPFNDDLLLQGATTTISTIPGITYNRSRLSVNAGLGLFFPGPGAFTDRYFGPNAFTEATPTPAITANAGPDQTVDEGASVSLDGSGSSGESLSFSWTQLAGPAVALSGADGPTPFFTAPLLTGGFGSQVLTFQLTVTSGSQSSTDTVDVTVANVNNAPMAEAVGPATVNEGSPVTLSGATSFDPDGDPIASFLWEQTGGPPVTLTGANTATPTFTAPQLAGGLGGAETLMFRLTVSDGSLSDTDEVAVVVEQVNHAPTANAGPDQTKDEGNLVTLDGTASGDVDNDPLVSFTWSQIAGSQVILSDIHAPMPTFIAPPVGPGGDMLVFRLVVSDGGLESIPDGDLSDVTITIRNLNDPPSCAAAQASPAVLWPPNHKLVSLTIVGLSDPNGDPVTVIVTGVTQDEPVNGLGDGDTSPDAVIVDGSALLRAERSGTGNGRVYQVNFTAADAQGGSCSGSVTVSVPHSMKGGGSAANDGQLYDSTLP